MGLFNRMFGKGDARNELPSREAFAQLFLEELARNGDARAYRFEGEAFHLVAMHERHVVPLEAAFAAYTSAPPLERAEVLTRAVQTAMSTSEEVPEAFADAAPRLLPLLYSRAEVERLVLQARLDDRTTRRLSSRLVGTHGAVVIGYDTPEAERQLDNSTLEYWAVSFDRALETALHNLRMQTPLPWRRVRPGLYVSPWQDQYDASRLLLLDEIRALAVEGEPVALAPHRSGVIVTGSRDEANLHEMATMAGAMGTPEHRVSGVPWILRGDAWETWEPAGEAFRELRLAERAVDYDAQKQQLESVMGTDTLVASFTLARDERTGLRVSYGAWAGETRTLLPEVDMITFGPPPDSLGPIAWAQVQTGLAERLTRTEHWPPRYEAFGYPTMAEFDALGLKRR